MSAAATHRIEVTFATASPQLAESLRAIEALPLYSEERAECLGFLYLTLARHEWSEVDRIRQSRRERAARAERAAARKAAKP